jgi:hypothetical protein
MRTFWVSVGRRDGKLFTTLERGKSNVGAAEGFRGRLRRIRPGQPGTVKNPPSIFDARNLPRRPSRESYFVQLVQTWGGIVPLTYHYDKEQQMT